MTSSGMLPKVPRQNGKIVMVIAILATLVGSSFVVSGCSVEAFSSKAAPVQAVRNMEQIALALRIMADSKCVPKGSHCNSIESEYLRTWRQTVAPLLDERSGPNPIVIPDQFRVPLTCSHSSHSKTNVFLIADTFTSEEGTDQNGQPVILHRVPNPGDNALIVIDKFCTSWEGPQVVAIADSASSKSLASLKIRDLPEIAKSSPAYLVTFGGSVTRIQSTNAVGGILAQ